MYLGFLAHLRGLAGSPPYTPASTSLARLLICLLRLAVEASSVPVSFFSHYPSSNYLVTSLYATENQPSFGPRSLTQPAYLTICSHHRSLQHAVDREILVATIRLEGNSSSSRMLGLDLVSLHFPGPDNIFHSEWPI
jgi:hypothetical protein